MEGDEVVVQVLELVHLALRQDAVKRDGVVGAAVRAVGTED